MRNLQALGDAVQKIGSQEASRLRQDLESEAARFDYTERELPFAGQLARRVIERLDDDGVDVVGETGGMVHLIYPDLDEAYRGVFLLDRRFDQNSGPLAHVLQESATTVVDYYARRFRDRLEFNRLKAKAN